MNHLLAYLKAIIEGEPDLEPWKSWFEKNDAELQALLPRTKYLALKINRIESIPAILSMHEIPFDGSDRYAYLGGIDGRCRDCGAEHQRAGSFTWCPNGCFRRHALIRPRNDH